MRKSFSMFIRLFSAFLFIFSANFVVFAQQRPLLTEDVDITPTGAVRIAAGVDFYQNAKFPLSGLKGDLTKVGDIDLRIGISSNVELQIQGTMQNFLSINSQAVPSPIPLNISSNSANDVGDITVAAKIKIRNESKKFPGIASKFGFQMPNADQARGIGTNQVNIFSKIILQKGFGRQFANQQYAVNVFTELGLGIMPAPLRNFTQNDVLLYGTAVNIRFNKRINIVSEINGRMNTRSSDAPLGTESVSQFRIGTQIKASGLRFDTAAIIGLTKYSPRSGVTFGVTYTSPSIFKPPQ